MDVEEVVQKLTSKDDRKRIIEQILLANTVSYFLTFCDNNIFPIIHLSSMGYLVFSMPANGLKDNNSLLYTDQESCSTALFGRIAITKLRNNIELVPTADSNYHVETDLGIVNKIYLSYENVRIFYQYVDILTKKPWFNNNPHFLEIKEEYIPELQSMLKEFNDMYIISLKEKMRILVYKYVKQFTMNDLLMYFMFANSTVNNNKYIIFNSVFLYLKYEPKLERYILYTEYSINHSLIAINKETIHYFSVEQEQDTYARLQRISAFKDITYMMMTTEFAHFLNEYITVFNMVFGNKRIKDIFEFYDTLTKSYMEIDSIPAVDESRIGYFAIKSDVDTRLINEVNDRLNAIYVVMSGRL